MIAYKVCKKETSPDGEVLDISANYHMHLNHALCLSYPDNTIVIAPSGSLGIFIFTSLDDAITFRNKMPGRFIKSVETLARVIPRKHALLSFDYLWSIFDATLYKRNLKCFSTSNIPSRTYTCRKVRVLNTVIGTKS